LAKFRRRVFAVSADVDSESSTVYSEINEPTLRFMVRRARVNKPVDASCGLFFVHGNADKQKGSIRINAR